MTKYKFKTTHAKIYATQALKSKLIFRREVIEEAQDKVAYMLKQNKRRLQAARLYVRIQTIEPGRSQARKDLQDVTRRSKDRLAVPLKSLETRKKNLKRLVDKIKRFQKQGRCYKIL